MAWGLFLSDGNVCLKEYEEKHTKIESEIVNHTAVIMSCCLQRLREETNWYSLSVNLSQGPCFPWTNFSSKLHHKI